jgi:transcriptional regulator with XRE-family HTH domain
LALSLKRLRAERDMSLSALAALSGLPQSTLSKVENGQMSLNYDKLVVLAEVFEIDVRQLFMTETEAAAESGQMARRAIDRASNAFATLDHMRYRYLSTELRHRLMLPAEFDVGTPKVADHDIEMMDVVGQRFAYVVEGPVDFLCEQYEPVTLQTGDAIYIDSAMPHAFVTRDGRRARIVTVLASANPEYLELAREATKQGAVDASNTFRQRARARRTDPS